VTEIEEGPDGMVGDIDEGNIMDIGLPIPPARLEIHLGGLMFATATRGRVELRAYHGGSRGLLETASYSREVVLDQGEICRLMDGIWSLNERWRGLKGLQPCRQTHNSRAEVLECGHCSPTGETVEGVPRRHPGVKQHQRLVHEFVCFNISFKGGGRGERCFTPFSTLDRLYLLKGWGI